MASQKVTGEVSAERDNTGSASPNACCANPNLTWTPVGLVESLITCTHCGFRIDPDGLLLDWLDPEEIRAAWVIEENTPRILELAGRLGLIQSRMEQPGGTARTTQGVSYSSCQQGYSGVAWSWSFSPAKS